MWQAESTVTAARALHPKWTQLDTGTRALILITMIIIANLTRAPLARSFHCHSFGASICYLRTTSHSLLDVACTLLARVMAASSHSCKCRLWADSSVRFLRRQRLTWACFARLHVRAPLTGNPGGSAACQLWVQISLDKMASEIEKERSVRHWGCTVAIASSSITSTMRYQRERIWQAMNCPVS